MSKIEKESFSRRDPEIYIANAFIGNHGMAIIAAVTTGIEEQDGEELRVSYPTGASLHVERERGELLIVEHPSLKPPPFVLTETAVVVDSFIHSVAFVGPPDFVRYEHGQVQGILVAAGGEMATFRMKIQDNPHDIFVKAGEKVQTILRIKR